MRLSLEASGKPLTSTLGSTRSAASSVSSTWLTVTHRPPTTYHATVDNPKGERGHPVRYRKFFRVDGQIDDADWGRIVAHFFRSNDLVIEYFGELLDERPGAPAIDEPPGFTVPAIVS